MEIEVRNGEVILSGERLPTFGHVKEAYSFNLSKHIREIIRQELDQKQKESDK